VSDWTRQKLEDHLLDYLYDELEPDERRAFERGLIAHPEVAAELAAHQRTRRAFVAELGPAPALPAGALDRVEAALTEAAGKGTATPTGVKKGFWTTFSEGLRGLVFRPTFALAMVGLLVGGVALYTSRQDEVSSLGERVESQALPPVPIQPAPAVMRTETVETVSRAMAEPAEPPAEKADAPAGASPTETTSASPAAKEMAKDLAPSKPLADKQVAEAKATPKTASGYGSTNMLGGKGLAVQGGAFATDGAMDDAAAEARKRAEYEAQSAKEEMAKAEKSEQEYAARAMAAPPATEGDAPADEAPRPAKSAPPQTDTATGDRDVVRKDSGERQAPAAPPQESRGQTESKPAEADRLWTLGQQQVAAGAWSDAERTLAQLAKAEGETDRVKKLRAQLKARPAQVQRASEDQLPPDPPKPAPPQD
jgi:hypothetical protein